MIIISPIKGAYKPKHGGNQHKGTLVAKPIAEPAPFSPRLELTTFNSQFSRVVDATGQFKGIKNAEGFIQLFPVHAGPE